MLRRVLPLFALALLAPPAGAASDLKNPYKVRVVVDVARHRLLTDVYHEKVAKQLGDGIQAALGPLAKVEALTKHDKLDDVRTRGLERALRDWRERSEYRTYFVRLDIVGTFYRVQTRLHDGLTGLPSPAVRTARTRDRDYVAREAALLIERDLGLLGTITSEPDGQRSVTVELKGGGIAKVDTSKWVKQGEVFQVVRVAGAGAGQVVPWTYLQAEGKPKGGVVTCKFWSRYKLPTVTGLRCVLLSTRSGPLRLRLREERPGGRPGALEAPVTLQVRRRGFEGEDATRLDRTTDSDLDTSRLSKNRTWGKLAFVTVLSSGNKVRARIPVPVTDEPVTLLTIPPGGEEEDGVTFRHRSLQRNVIVAYLVQMQLFKEINELTAKPDKRAEALAKVQATLKRLRDDHERLSKEREELSEELEKHTGKNKPTLTVIDQRLEAIKSGEDDLRKHVAVLKKIEQEENDPEKKEWLIQEERAKQLVKDAELGQAIKIYEKAPKAFQSAALKNHLAALRKQWATADDEHRKAREFIYETWPKIDSSAKLKESMKEARSAFETCKKNKDKVGPLKLLKASDVHVERLRKEAAELKPEINVDDEKPAKLLLELIPELQKLVTDVTEHLKKKE